MHNRQISEDELPRLFFVYLLFRKRTKRVKRNDRNRFKAIAKGNLKEFELLFREFYIPLLNYANKFTHNEADSEEIVQDVFCNVWKNKEHLEIQVSISSYLYRSVYNNALQLIKRKKLNTQYTLFAKAQEGYSPNPEEEFHYEELCFRVNKILGELPERCQQVFTLNRFQGFKYKEIAEKLSISIKTVEANMSKALKHFRKKIDEYPLNNSN